MFTMLCVMDQVFENETIVLDGYHFIGCSFIDCIIIITSEKFDFDRCSYSGTTFYVDPELPIFDKSPSIFDHVPYCAMAKGEVEIKELLR